MFFFFMLNCEHDSKNYILFLYKKIEEFVWVLITLKLPYLCHAHAHADAHAHDSCVGAYSVLTVYGK